MKRLFQGALLLTFAFLAFAGTARAQSAFLNASYDPTREFYHEYDNNFQAYWKQRTGQTVKVHVSNGGSGKQAQAVVDGLQADVVTLALAYDVDHIARAGLINPGWQHVLPYNSTPYTSTIVFIVRSGNPKHIKDWDDLVRPGIQVVLPNPKTSGGARWAFLAAYGYALKHNGGNQAAAKAFVTKLYKNAPVLPSGARAATDTFLKDGVGDVLVSWENEAYLITNKLGKGWTQIVDPSISILTEPPVAIVDKNVDAHHTRQMAVAYVSGLYTVPGQTLAAKYYYRPRITKGVPANYLAVFPKIKLFTIDQVFGGWAKAQPEFFGNGGVFDRIYSDTGP